MGRDPILRWSEAIDEFNFEAMATKINFVIFFTIIIDWTTGLICFSFRPRERCLIM